MKHCTLNHPSDDLIIDLRDKVPDLKDPKPERSLATSKLHNIPRHLISDQTFLNEMDIGWAGHLNRMNPESPISFN